jgi:hypothetical protein
MKAFANGLNQKLDQAVADFQLAKTLESYCTLQEVTLVKMIVFNRRRGLDCSTATLADYRCAQEQKLCQQTDEAFTGLTEHQTNLAKSHCLMTVNGKSHKNISFIILNAQLQTACDLIIEHREDVGQILPENEFIFARSWSKDGFMRHSSHLKRMAEAMGVANMSTRGLRKYLATAFQVTVARCLLAQHILFLDSRLKKLLY